jgi:dihydroflavonol-4-reductase
LILVVGALSFLGSHIVYQLIEKGYHVRGTVSPDYHTLVAAMEKVVSKLPRVLELVPLDILDESSWCRVFADVGYVFYLAAPRSFDFTVQITESFLPILIGTTFLMHHANLSKTVKKIIFTSCYCALADVFSSNREYSEEDWNKESSMVQNTYEFSKTRAEKLATQLASQPGSEFQFVSILPGVLLGAPIFPRLSPSHNALRLFLDGSFISKFELLALGDFSYSL